MGQVFTCGHDLYNHWYNLYTRGWDVFTCKNVLFTCSYIFYSHGCNKFLPLRMFLTLADTTSILMFAMYLHVRIFCTLTRSIHLLFPWVQCQSLKPLLSQCTQTGFVTVDDFIALYTRSYIFYSQGCKKISTCKNIFHTRWFTIIFTMLTNRTNFYHVNRSLAWC